jgi:glycine/D-amino acid oxidase-like deaminating enzyme
MAIHRHRIAVLGAGIMGSSAAIFRSRKGFRVTLIDPASEPMSMASRWHESKIHLGHFYAADPSLHTARHVQPGSLAFRPLLDKCLGRFIGLAMTDEDDIISVIGNLSSLPMRNGPTFRPWLKWCEPMRKLLTTS